MGGMGRMGYLGGMGYLGEMGGLFDGLEVAFVFFLCVFYIFSFVDGEVFQALFPSLVYGQGVDTFRQSVDDEAYADDDQWRGCCCHGLHQGEDARE